MSDQTKEQLDGLVLRAAKTIMDYCKITACKNCCLSFVDLNIGSYECGILSSVLPDRWEVDE